MTNQIKITTILFLFMAIMLGLYQYLHNTIIDKINNISENLIDIRTKSEIAKLDYELEIEKLNNQWLLECVKSTYEISNMNWNSVCEEKRLEDGCELYDIETVKFLYETRDRSLSICAQLYK